MIRRLTFTLALCLCATFPALADPGQDFIIEKVNQQYHALLRQVGSNSEKGKKIKAIYKRTIKVVQSQAGLKGRGDAEAGVREMMAIAR